MSQSTPSPSGAHLPSWMAEVAVFHDMEARFPPRVLVHEFQLGRLDRKTGGYGDNCLAYRGRDVMAFMAGRDVTWTTGRSFYESSLEESDGYCNDFSLEDMAECDAIREELGDSCPQRVYVVYRTCDRAEKDQVVRQLVDATQRMLNEQMLFAVRQWSRVQEVVSSGALGPVSASMPVDDQAIADLLTGQVPADAQGCGQAAAREALAMIASDVMGGGESPLASIDAAVAALLQARETARLAMLHVESLKGLDASVQDAPSADQSPVLGR